MKAPIDKTPENKNQVTTNEPIKAQVGREGVQPFTDNRPETTQLQQLQGMANQSAQLAQIGQLQSMANTPQRIGNPLQDKNENVPSPSGEIIQGRFFIQSDGTLINWAFAWIAGLNSYQLMSVANIPSDWINIGQVGDDSYFIPPPTAAPLTLQQGDESDEEQTETEEKRQELTIGELEPKDHDENFSSEPESRGEEISMEADSYPIDQYSPETISIGERSTTDVHAQGTFVFQDNLQTREERDHERQLRNELEHRIYHYIGTGLAYTFYMSQCTAVALHDSGTGLSFLAHFDSTNENSLGNAIIEYFLQVTSVGQGENHDAATEMHEMIEVNPELPIRRLTISLYMGTTVNLGLSTRVSSAEEAARIIQEILNTPNVAEFIEDVVVTREVMSLSEIDGGGGGYALVTVGQSEPAMVAQHILSPFNELDMALDMLFLGQHHIPTMDMSVTGILLHMISLVRKNQFLIENDYYEKLGKRFVHVHDNMPGENIDEVNSEIDLFIDLMWEIYCNLNDRLNRGETFNLRINSIWDFRRTDESDEGYEERTEGESDEGFKEGTEEESEASD